MSLRRQMQLNLRMADQHREALARVKREKLARWWHSLSKRERAAIRQQFLARLDSDAEFRAEVDRLKG